MKICSEVGCGKKHLAKGLCKAHYRKKYRLEKEREQLRAYRLTDKGKQVASNWNTSEGKKKAAKRYYESPRTRWSFCKTRSLEIGQPSDLLYEDYCDLILQPCNYCGGSLNASGAGLDRLDNELGYVKTNVVPCCRGCNVLRSNLLSPVELVKVIELIKDMRGTEDIWKPVK